MLLEHSLKRDLGAYGLTLYSIDRVEDLLGYGAHRIRVGEIGLDDVYLTVLNEKKLKISLKARVNSREGIIATIKWSPKLSKIGKFRPPHTRTKLG